MQTSYSPFSCPRCIQTLHMARVGAIPVHGCGGCGGIWLDNDATSRVIAKINPEVVSLAQQAGVRAQARVDEQPSIACPACSAPLRRVPGGDPSVQVDICEAHGTWFDRNELQQVSALAEQKRRARQGAGLAAGAAGAAGAALAGVALAQQPGQAEVMAQGASNLLSSAADTLGSAGAGLIEVGGQALSVGVDVAADVASTVVIEGAAELLIGGVCAIIEGIFS